MLSLSVFFYQSVENGSINRDVYAVKLDGRKKQRLSENTGTNIADLVQIFLILLIRFLQ